MFRPLILCLLLLVSGASWRYVVSSPAERFYVSDERTDRDGRGGVGRWVKQSPRSDTSQGRETRREYVAWLADRVGSRKAAAYAYATGYREYDCPAGRFRLSQFLVHSRDDDVLYTLTDDELGGWQSPPPASASEKLMRDACTRPAELQ